jgi:hypothetical protein
MLIQDKVILYRYRIDEKIEIPFFLKNGVKKLQSQLSLPNISSIKS